MSIFLQRLSLLLSLLLVAQSAEAYAPVSWTLSGYASSITKSGIGISTSTDTSGAIKPIFNAAKVNADLNAQVAITQSFSQQAPKAVADFSASQAAALRKAGNEAEAQKWDEGGAYRVILHTVSGALSGGTNGAAGALTTASAAPLLDDLQAKTQAALQSLGIPPEKAKSLSQGLAQLTSAGMGAAAGGVQGAATGLTVDTNNRQLHPSEKLLIAELAKKAKNDAEKEARLNDAACYLVHCAAQYPEGSQERRYYQSVEARGQANSYELQQLADAQKTDPTLFNYSFSDKGLDLGKKTLDTTLTAAGKVVDLGKGVAIGAGDTIVQAGALALDAAQLAGAGVAGDSASNVDPVSGLGKAIQQNGVFDTVANIPGNTLRGVADAAHAAGQGDLQPLGEIAGAVAVPVVAGKVLGSVADAAVKRPDFYVTPDGVAVPATGYRAVGDSAVDEAASGLILPRDPATYLTFDNISNLSPLTVQDLLQLPRTPSHWVSFDTLQIINDVKIPMGRWNTTTTPEPFAITFPEYGITGGGSQAITNTPILTNEFGVLPRGRK